MRARPAPDCAVLLLLLVLAAGCGGTSLTQLAAPSSVKCQPALSGVPASVPASGARVTASVSTTRDCLWSASTTDSWLQVEPASGQGDASLTIVAAQNTATSVRSATININGVSATVSQEAAPPPPPPAPKPNPAPTPAPTPTPTPAPNPGPSSSVTFSGRVTNASGKCPSLSFVVDGRQVVTDAATDFTGGPCKNVRDGATVTVYGEQRGSAVYATRVAFNKG